MKTIFKYPITVDDHFYIHMPKGANILTVQMQNDKPYIWAEVDDKEPESTHYFSLVGTGHPIYKDNMKYIGTFQIMKGTLVFHLYYRGETYEKM